MRNFYGHGGLLAELTPKSQAPTKLAQPFSALALRADRLRTLVGQKLQGSFTGGSFRKGMRVPIGVPGGEVWGQVQGGVGGVFLFLWKMREKGKGREWGVGWGLAKEPGSQCTRACQNYPLANYPLVTET